MGLSYRPLWRMLKNLNITKMEFAKKVDISNATLAKLGKDEPVALTIIEKICNEFNCDIGNVVTYKTESSRFMLPIDELTVGTIVICPCYPIGSPLGRSSFSTAFRREKLMNRKSPCIILKKYEIDDDNIHTQFLVAPLSYDPLPDTIFDVYFKDVDIENELQTGYIHLSKMGYVYHHKFEKILGQMPDQYMNESIELLEKIKTICIIKD